MASHVAVYCSLPHGLVLTHPIDPSKKVVLKGVNSSSIKGAKYGVTPVDADFWEQWYTVHKDHFPALKNNAIFVAKNTNEGKAKAKDFKAEKTGLEPLVPGEHGVKTVAKDDKDDDKDGGDEADE